MNKTLLGLAVCAAAPLADAAGQAENPSAPVATQQISRAGTQASAVGPADYFSGRVRVDPLFAASSPINASGAYVTFEPGARSAWHTHPAGQRLVVVSGVGLTQEWGKPVQEIHPGDVIVCPPGIKHWHGAAPASAMTHLAVTGAVDGKSVQWLEKVSDDQYSAR
ncbi:4-carboxymuconolactone decarboxylase [Pseudomonas chlororaphis]|nr:4-carboxymuconolactone decarboxylase [Pseudomonas chlororaphis]